MSVRGTIPRMDDPLFLVAESARLNGVQQSAAMQIQMEMLNKQTQALIAMVPKPCAYCGGVPPRCCHSTDFRSR